MSNALRLHILASGSKGNASVLESADGLVLIDAGITCKQIITRMESLGLDPGRVRGIVVTHEHSDHIAGLRVTAKRLGVDVYATRGTSSSPSWERFGCPKAITIGSASPFSIAGTSVVAFDVPHDADEPVGFRFERAGDVVAYCTDIGNVTPLAASFLTGARVLALEANHDLAMLRDYDGYPLYLKRRIASDGGHLSNAQTCDALPALVSAATETVVGMHVSQHTNTPSVCREAIGAAAQLLPHTPRVLVASQETPLSV